MGLIDMTPSVLTEYRDHLPFADSDGTVHAPSGCWACPWATCHDAAIYRWWHAWRSIRRVAPTTPITCMTCIAEGA